MIPVLFFVTVLIFTMIRLIPGDPARTLLGEMALEEDVQRLRELMGLNKPYTTQYFIWMKGILTRKTTPDTPQLKALIHREHIQYLQRSDLREAMNGSRRRQ